MQAVEKPNRNGYRVWTRRILALALVVLACQQLWRHGRAYVLPMQLYEVVPGKIYRGAWQRDWPMRRIIRDHHIKTIVALAHPADHPLAVGEKKLAEELGVKWVHIPIVDDRSLADGLSMNELLDKAAATINDPANQPVYFHCHHGLNRASMAQIAYRTRYCGWTLEQAGAEINDAFGLIRATHGPDYRYMEKYYKDVILPLREADRRNAKLVPATNTNDSETQSTRTANSADITERSTAPRLR